MSTVFLAPNPVRASVDSVVVVLSSDRTAYYEGEPVLLTMTIENNSDERIRGHFLLNDDKHVDVIISRDDEQPFVIEKRPPVPFDVGWLQYVSIRRTDTLVVDPGKSSESYMVLLNAASGGLLLTSAGEYKVLAVCRPWSDQGIAIRSNVTQFTVKSPEGEDKAALEAYVRADLPRVVQSMVGTGLDRDALRRARGFLTEFPSSIYGKHVRKAVRQGLRALVTRGIATEEEVRLFEQFKTNEASAEAR